MLFFSNEAKLDNHGYIGCLYKHVLGMRRNCVAYCRHYVHDARF